MQATIPSTVEIRRDGFSEKQRYVNFFPETTNPRNLASEGIEGFRDENAGVRFYDKCPVNTDGTINLNAKLVGKKAEGVGYGFDDEASWSLMVRPLPEDPGRVTCTGEDAKHTAWMAIPVNSAEMCKWVGGRFCFADSSHINGCMLSVACAKKGSTAPVVLDMRYDKALNRGVGYAASTSLSSSQWANLSLDVQGLIDGANAVHGLSKEAREKLGENITDPGEITGIYLWRPQGSETKYMLVEVACLSGQADGTTDSTELLVDSIAVGNASSSTSAYISWNGTSMASPSVAGCVAVIAQGEPENATLSEDELSKEALERKAKLLASVDYDDDLAKLCRTGGRVNLKKQSAFTRKAPIISYAEDVGGTLEVSGCFFGSYGELAIDDKVVTTSTWSDDMITASLEGIANGSHVARVTNPDGAVMRIVFSSSSVSENGKQLYERTHATPMGVEDFSKADEAKGLYGNDGFHGNMVVCDDCLYAMTATNISGAEALWCFDPAAEAWRCCASLPDDLRNSRVENASLAALDDSIYVYTYRVGMLRTTPRLWCYDVKADSWSLVKMDGLMSGGQTFTIDGKLYLVTSFIPDEGGIETAGGASVYADANDATDSDGDGPVNFTPNYPKVYQIDVDKGQLALVGTIEVLGLGLDGGKGAFVAASGNSVYCISIKENDEIDTLKGLMVRADYDAASGTFKVEDLSDIANSLVGQGAESASNYGNIALAAIPDGVALVSPKNPGHDTYIIKNGEKTATEYERTSTYHTPIVPLAACDGEWLYTMAMCMDEPEAFYLRSTRVYDSGDNPIPDDPSGSNKPTPANTGTKATPKTGDSMPIAPLGVLTIVSGAVLALSMTRMRRR